jgi:hypothetical protein
MNHTRMLTWLLKLLLLGHVASASYRGAGDAQGRTRGRLLQQMNDDTAPANKNDVVSTDSPVSPKAPTPVPSPVPMHGGMSLSSPPTLIVVDLLPFVVSVDGGTTQSLTNTLKTLLANEMQKEFDSFLSVGLRVQNGTISGGTLDYGGTASFDGLVGYQNVQNVQARVLQDSTSIHQYAPYVTSITMSNEASHSSWAGLIVVVLVLTIGMGFAAFYGYRHYKKAKSLASTPVGEGVDDQKPRKELPNPSDDFSQSVLSYDGPHTESEDGSLEDYSTTTDLEAGMMARTTASSTTSSHTPGYRATQRSTTTSTSSGRKGALDDSSMTDSEAGLNSTQLYLSQRRKERVFHHNQQQQQADLTSNKSLLLYESDADCSYDYVVKRGMESDDDDLYTTDNEAGESSTVGNFGLLGKGRDSDDEDDFDDVDNFDNIDIPMATPKKPVPKSAQAKDLPFDEVSMASSCHNDDRFPPNASAAAAGMSTQYGHDDEDEQGESPYGQTRSAGPTKNTTDSNYLGLASFLRGRRNATQAARQTQR